MNVDLSVIGQQPAFLQDPFDALVGERKRGVQTLTYLLAVFFMADFLSTPGDSSRAV